MSRQRYRLLVVLIVALWAVVGAASGAPAGVSDGRPALAGPSLQDGVGVAQNNSTVQHRDPESYREDGDLVGLQDWFGDELAGRLGESALQLDQTEYEAAREVLGGEYDSYLSQYVDVAGETGRGDGSDFQETKEAQREFISDVREYRETREAYRDARENGDDGRARQLARELDRLQQQISRENQRIQQGYRAVTNSTGSDLSGASRRIQNTTQNITAEQLAMNDALFVETVFRVDEFDARFSFSDPFRISGVIQMENGTAVSSQMATIQVGERSISTSLDDAGRFSVGYRPTLLQVGNQELGLRYVPDAESVYLGSNESVTVTVEQVSPDLALGVDPGRRAYGETVRIDGSVVVNGTPVPGVPVALTIGDDRVGTVTSSANGSISVAIPLPARVQAGERRVRARIAVEDRAIGPANASTPLVVEQSETTLTVSGAPLQSVVNTDSSRGLLVSGWLETTSGRPVADQRVQLRIDGGTVTEVQTNSSGGYAALVQPPEDANESVVVAASFDGTGTNLGSSTSQVAVQLPPFADGSSLIEAVPRPWLWLSAVALVAAVGAGAYLRRVRRGSDSVQGEDEPGGDHTPGERREVGSSGHLLAGARERLDDGRSDEATETAYLVVRGALGSMVGLETTDRGRTHWEFLLDCEAAGLEDDRLGALRELTAAYEVAAFAGTSLDLAAAEDALAAGSRALSPEAA